MDYEDTARPRHAAVRYARAWSACCFSPCSSCSPSGFFVAAEFALVKVRSTQLDMRVAEGHHLAGVARSLLDHLDSYLSATQLGITLTSLGLGWVGEPAIEALLEPLFHELHFSEETSYRLSILIGFTIISFLHIVLGEVAPKSLAIARPVSTSISVSLPLRAFHWITYPALWVLNSSSALVLRLVGVEAANTHTLAVGGDEFIRMAKQSAAEGHISPHEGELVHKVFAFSDRVAREIMVPRHQVHGIDVDEPLAPQLSQALKLGHSRYPVFQTTLDHAMGVLHLKDLLGMDFGAIEPGAFQALLRPLLFVPGTLSAEKVMRRMQARRSHLALVVDERGSVAGLATLEDALEELVGEIQDEYDQELEPIQRLDDGGVAVAGSLLLSRLGSLLSVTLPSTRTETVQGWLMEKLERVPKPGDTVPFAGWTIHVVEVEERSVLRAEVRLDAPSAQEDEGQKQ